MGVIIAGVILWTAAHFFKRLAPAARKGLDDKLGAGPARGVMSGVIVASLLLMIFGYRSAEFIPLYDPIAGIGHLTVLLVLIAVAMMGMGNSKGKARSLLRHPMLTGVIVWAIAHLLVNGDLASLFLFGGVAMWAVANMMLINMQEGPWERPEPGPISGDIKLAVITLVIFVVIGGLHVFAGHNPFLGTYA